MRRALAGCGSSSTADSSSVGHAPAAAPLPRTLAAGAVPYLPSTRRALSASFLARESQVPGLAGRLAGWGYVAGAQRYFQGESRKLQVVDARTLRFRGAPGASAFVGFMRGHLNAYPGFVPEAALVHAWRAQRDRGRRCRSASAIWPTRPTWR